jgi:hypothetical protein
VRQQKSHCVPDNGDLSRRNFINALCLIETLRIDTHNNVHNAE